MKKRELKQLASTLARDLREERELALIRNGALNDLSAKLVKVDNDREYWKALAGVEHDMRLNVEKALTRMRDTLVKVTEEWEKFRAIQEREAAAMAMGESPGPGPQVDERVRIGGEQAEEEAKEEEAQRLLAAMIDAASYKEDHRGDQENAERSNDHQPGRLDTHLITGYYDAGYPFDSGINREVTYPFDNGIVHTIRKIPDWASVGRAQRQGADRQAGGSGRDGNGE
jgi:hypothetical protein